MVPTEAGAKRRAIGVWLEAAPPLSWCTNLAEGEATTRAAGSSGLATTRRGVEPTAMTAGALPLGVGDKAREEARELATEAIEAAEEAARARCSAR
mmetsp:Transcript_31936/g.80748  ORF Transcript_31936/g.80748 Transcript_31936/m.80748 type:complete len:96 (+) Transcript_31936:95-382(+)